MIKTCILLFLFEIGFGIKFNIIGEISISELFLLIYTPIIIAKIQWHHTKELKKITIAYVLLLCAQVFSEIMVHNVISNSLKGLAITIISYLHFLFLFYNLTKNKNLILVVIISQIAMKLIFGSNIEEQSTENILAGEAAGYLKFYVAPLVILIFLAISIIYDNKKMIIIFSLLGVSLIVLGARSSGGIALFSAMITYLIEHKGIIKNKKKLTLATFLLLIISYGIYALYVNQVLSGEISSGNNKQLLLCKNPYNPLELLIQGRREVWVGWQAFMDKFWFGHGAWTYDTTGHYQRLMYKLSGNLSELTRERVNLHYLIPSHSVIIGYAVINGIFAMLAMIYIVYFFLKKGIQSLFICNKRYLLILTYYLYNLFWNALFSPQTHFRQTLPIAFAIILFLYLHSNSKNEVKNVKV